MLSLHDNFTTASDWLLYPGRNYCFPKINILFHILAPGKILIVATAPGVQAAAHARLQLQLRLPDAELLQQLNNCGKKMHSFSRII